MKIFLINKEKIKNVWMYIQMGLILLVIVGAFGIFAYIGRQENEKKWSLMRPRCAEETRQSFRISRKTVLSSGEYTKEFLEQYNACFNYLDNDGSLIQDKVGPPMLSNSCFFGRKCSGDCSGHEAGYDWAFERVRGDGFPPDGCANISDSFTEGCNMGYEASNGLLIFGNECI